MGLFSPWFLAGLLAAGLPIYFHLLRQHKSTPLKFSSLQFFERSTQSSIKHRRLRYLLLMATRIALLVLLALAFTGPYIMRTILPGAAGERMHVFVIDNSFSMRESGRLEAAKQEALTAVSSMPGDSEGQIATVGASLAFLTQPTREQNELTAAIRTIEPSDARSSFGELARALRAMAETVREPLNVHLFSDMQRSALPSGFADLQLPATASLVLHSTTDDVASNFAVEAVSAPRSMFDPDKVRVQATISGYNAEAGKRTVSLVANGNVVDTRTVDVPENGRATAEFLSLNLPYGFNRCEVRIDTADRLREDDKYLFAVERADPRQLLFVHQGRDTRSPLYFQAALDASASAAFRVQTIEAEKSRGVDPSRYAVVILSDVGQLPGDFEQALKQWVRTGGAVLVAAGSNTARRQNIPIFDGNVIESRYASRSGARFQTAAAADPTHPSVRRTEGLESVKFYHSVVVETGDAEVIARLTDETPLIAERQIGEGRVLFFASTFDNIANDFPLHPSFVPFVERSVEFLGDIEQRTSNVTVGSFVDLRQADSQGQGVELIDPDGNRPLSLDEAARTETYQVAREGFYELRRANDRNEMIAVNADRRESDLSLIPQETLALWQNTGEGIPEEVAAVEAEVQRKPWPLWWYFLLLVLAAAMIESLLSSRYLSVDRGAA